MNSKLIRCVRTICIQTAILLMIIHTTELQLPLLSKIPEPVLAFFKKYHKTTNNTNCTENNVQLTELFIFICNNIGSGDNYMVMRDACVGCFRTETTSNNNQPSLVGLNSCSQTYLAQSRYEPCMNLIDLNAVPVNGCISGYCQFVKCLRRINSDLLIAECFDEASLDNAAVFESDRVILVKNITSCILAKTRCASINPITGRKQTGTTTIVTYEKWIFPKAKTITLSDALQVSPEGDLRIINFPSTTKIQEYFCSGQPVLKQSGWLDFNC